MEWTRMATLERTFPFPRARYTGILEWVTTTDHKKIGVLYLVTTFFFFLMGGLLALGIRTQLGFNYTGVATAGSPRISLPIDVTGDGTTDFYAFIGAFYCNDGAGLVDPIHDSTCTIFYTGGPDSGYPNWAAFVAAHQTWHVGAIPFVIADDAGFWTVSNVHLGEAAATSDKNNCKSGGWKDLERADGSSFKNQGDCIQYVNTGK